MTNTERIQMCFQRLPLAMQEEVLHWIEHIVAADHDSDECSWWKFSMMSALDGMENENDPEYNIDDIKVKF